MPSDLDNLQGVWNIVSLEIDGQELPANSLGESQIIVKGTSFTSSEMTATYKGKVELDAAKRPKTVDLHKTRWPTQGQIASPHL